MAKSETIKAAIDANINTNGNQAITGAVMNSVLKQMVDSTDAQLTELSAETTIVEETDTLVDMDVTDSEGNVLVRLNDGHIETKKFKSQRTIFVEGDSSESMDLCDSAGNVLLRISNGHIRTKHFSSANFKKENSDLKDIVENTFYSGPFRYDIVTIWDYYAAYDELCDYRGDIIKCIPIGYSSIPTGSRAEKDPYQYPINLYRIPNPSAVKRLVLMGAIHGDSQYTDANPTENGWFGDQGDAQECILAPYFFIKDLLLHMHDNKEYQNLLRNYEIDIIPIINPWGVQNHSRRNGNDVDLNRNFDVFDTSNNSRWELDTSIYKGSQPFSEQESQAIRNYINSHNDIHLVVECHARGQVNIDGDYRFFSVTPQESKIRDKVEAATRIAKETFGAGGGYKFYTRDTANPSCYAWIYYEKGIDAFEPELAQSIGNEFYYKITLDSAKRLTINDTYTCSTPTNGSVKEFIVQASDGSNIALVSAKDSTIMPNARFSSGVDTVHVLSSKIIPSKSRHNKRVNYCMAWFYRYVLLNIV